MINFFLLKNILFLKMFQTIYFNYSFHYTNLLNNNIFLNHIIIIINTLI